MVLDELDQTPHRERDQRFLFWYGVSVLLVLSCREKRCDGCTLGDYGHWFRRDGCRRLPCVVQFTGTSLGDSKTMLPSAAGCGANSEASSGFSSDPVNTTDLALSDIKTFQMEVASMLSPCLICYCSNFAVRTCGTYNLTFSSEHPPGWAPGSPGDECGPLARADTSCHLIMSERYLSSAPIISLFGMSHAPRVKTTIPTEALSPLRSPTLSSLLRTLSDQIPIVTMSSVGTTGYVGPF